MRSLFAGLFSVKNRATEEYQRALEDAQQQQAEGTESGERKEGEPKCWIN